MKLLFLLLLFANIATQADVVKPALVEISIFENKTLEVRIDLNLEAAMTGIGTQYKNTTDSPDSARYDELRALEPNNLRQKFKKFETEFLNSLQLKINSEQQSLSLTQVDIDIVGYKKRPRKTTLTYTAKLTEWPKALSWQYGKIHGDSALRWQIYQANEYNWSQWQWLRGGDPSGVIHIDHPEFQSDTQRFFQFIKIGFDHVVPLGWDHILFIIGMALSSLLWGRLLLLVSAFTLAHTLTLGLAMIEVLEVSARFVEPLIAFSIAYVAIENLLIKQSIKRKTVIVFLFGLVHGLGFAGMLQEFELSPESFLSTLIGFNVGVELAQVMIVTVVVMLLLSLRALGWNYRQLVVIPVSVLIALIGFWWGLERLFG